MNFKNWLKDEELKTQEAVTDTGDVAIFARPIGIGSTRMYPDPVVMDDPNDKRKKRKKDNS
jgi:hypothetical protein